MSLPLLLCVPQTPACSTGERKSKSKRSNTCLGNEEWQIIVGWEADAEAERSRLAIRKEKNKWMARGSRCGTTQPEDRRHNWCKVGTTSLVAMRC